MYSQGVADALMTEDITFRTTIGVSAGAMTGVGYVAGQIGWAARINLKYRQDSRYVGIGAMRRDHGITGFSFLFDDLIEEYPMDRKRFLDPATNFVAVATDMFTGEPEYFKKGECNILRAVRASATVPYISRPVVINGVPYLDGGCSVNVPYDWAKENYPGKIIVVRTRDRAFRCEEKKVGAADKILYRNYPEFIESNVQAHRNYNEMLDRLDEDEAKGEAFVFAPEEPITIDRFEGDVQKLGELYETGYRETKARIPELLRWLEV